MKNIAQLAKEEGFTPDQFTKEIFKTAALIATTKLKTEDEVFISRVTINEKVYEITIEVVDYE